MNIEITPKKNEGVERQRSAIGPVVIAGSELQAPSRQVRPTAAAPHPMGAGFTLQTACGDKVAGRTTDFESFAALTAVPKASSRAA